MSKPDPNSTEGDKFVAWWETQDLGPAHRMTAWKGWAARASQSEAVEISPRAVAEECIRMAIEYEDQSETGDAFNQLVQNMRAYRDTLPEDKEWLPAAK